MSTDLLVRDPTRIGGPAPSVTAPRTFRPDIQGLRAIAVLLVVLFHSGVTRLSGGFVGVDVFFVISGFLITQHLLRDVASYGRIRFAGFYASRARRLLPMACLVIILALGATWYLTSALDTHQMAVDALWTSFFAMNIHLAINGVDYQANQDPSPLDHYWSLAVEEQFYLVWPALLAAIVFLALKFGASRRTAILVAGAGMLAVFIGSLTDSIIEVQSAATSAYFLAASRAWELRSAA